MHGKDWHVRNIRRRHCAGIIGFCMVDSLNVPAPLAVLAGGVLGVIGWAANMN